jgi:hypothetical protein
MPFKVQNFFNINSRLPFVQRSITSTKYFVINSTGNSRCFQIDQKTIKMFVRISALASKKRSNQKSSLRESK